MREMVSLVLLLCVTLHCAGHAQQADAEAAATDQLIAEQANVDQEHQGQALPQFSIVNDKPLDADRLQVGEVILRFERIDDDIQRVRGWVLINTERSLVWSVLVDCQQALEYVPNMRECEVRDRGTDADGHGFELTYHRIKPYFFLPAVENIFHAVYLPPEQIRFRKAGGDLVHFQGRWVFQAAAAHKTLLHYDAEVDLRASVNVTGERRMIRKDVREMLLQLKRQVELLAAEETDGRRGN